MEDELRKVGLQDLHAISQAHQRAEQELFEARDALQEKSEWLRIVLESIGDAVLTTDVEGRVTYLNGSAERLIGWSEAEALGRPLTGILRIVDRRTHQEISSLEQQALREGNVIDAANRTAVVASDGTEHPIEYRAAPVLDAAGAAIGVVLVFRDVGDRLGVQAAQARLAAIVESSEDAVVSKTLDGIIQSWNSGAERLFGYAASEAIGRSIELIIPADRLAEERDIIARLRRGERVEHFETERLTKSGRLVPISLTVSPIRDANGVPIGASKVARDITDRIRIETALAEVNRRKDEFLPLLAHELRNPLAPLRNGIEILRLAGGDPDLIERARVMMERQLGHMVRLVDDLLDISRITRNKMELRRARVLLADVLNSAIDTARPAIAAAGHKFVTELPLEPISLHADFTRLAQVFGNLLTNSAKYTPREGRIILSAERQGEVVAVTVRDSGIGIPAAALPQIFEMFSQVDRSIERASGGLGIGLALVRGLVEMHGGTVVAESPGAGQGSTFTVRLPALPADASRPSDQRVESTAPTSRSARRILIVDDNVDSAESMAAMLRLLGDEVRTVHDGLAAIGAAESFGPEVVLMDIGMPRLNGYDATQRLRATARGPALTIIALTGWGQEIDRARSREAGCDGHLVKPIELAALEKLLNELHRDASSRPTPP